MAAALMSDIGMREIQHVLFEQIAPLSSEQKAIVSTHPSRSCELLQAAGVEDKRWLESIEQHHERVDGEQHKIACLLSPQDHSELLSSLGTIWSMRPPMANQFPNIY